MAMMVKMVKSRNVHPVLSLDLCAVHSLRQAYWMDSGMVEEDAQECNKSQTWSCEDDDEFDMREKEGRERERAIEIWEMTWRRKKASNALLPAFIIIFIRWRVTELVTDHYYYYGDEHDDKEHW